MSNSKYFLFCTFGALFIFGVMYLFSKSAPNEDLRKTTIVFGALLATIVFIAGIVIYFKESHKSLQKDLQKKKVNV